MRELSASTNRVYRLGRHTHPSLASTPACLVAPGCDEGQQLTGQTPRPQSSNRQSEIKRPATPREVGRSLCRLYHSVQKDEGVRPDVCFRHMCVCLAVLQRRSHRNNWLRRGWSGRGLARGPLSFFVCLIRCRHPLPSRIESFGATSFARCVPSYVEGVEQQDRQNQSTAHTHTARDEPRHTPSTLCTFKLAERTSELSTRA